MEFLLYLKYKQHLLRRVATMKHNTSRNLKHYAVHYHFYNLVGQERLLWVTKTLSSMKVEISDLKNELNVRLKELPNKISVIKHNCEVLEYVKAIGNVHDKLLRTIYAKKFAMHQWTLLVKKNPEWWTEVKEILNVKQKPKQKENIL